MVKLFRVIAAGNLWMNQFDWCDWAQRLDFESYWKVRF